MTSLDTAQAHEKGDFILRLGIAGTNINKDPISEALPTVEDAIDWDFEGAGVNVKDDIAPALDVTWLFSEKVGLNVTAAAYKHDVRGRYSGEDEDLEELDGLNLIEMKQRHLGLGLVYYPRGNTESRVHPYVGVGASYTRAKLMVHRDLLQLALDETDEDLADGWITEEEAAEERLLIQEAGAVRASGNNWGGHVQFGADFNLTDKFLINTQVRYTRAASDLGYWNYMVGVGVKF